MNPQTDNTADPLKQRLNQMPPARPSSQLNVPQRPIGSLEDIDDSAFTVDASRPPMPTPVSTPQPPQPLQPTPNLPPGPREATPTPQPAPLPPVQPVPQYSPTPQIPPSVAQPLAPSSPPPTPQPPAAQGPTGELPKIPPMPVTPVEVEPQPQPSPTPPPLSPQPPQPSVAPPAQIAQSPATSFQPPTNHIAHDLIERIDETPQQNSKDIETLIEHNHRLHRLKSFVSFLAFCAGVIIAAFLINQFIFQSYYVDGTSMTPTLQNNDRLIIDKVEHTMANLQNKSYIPERGQVVVLDSSLVGLNGREEQLIKRVIGLPGDTIAIRDGTVTVKNAQNPNGFDPAQQLGLRLAPTYVESPQEWTIEQNQLFVMGDNRTENGSYDSRAFGPIESKKIVGRLWARILPFDKAQLF